MGRSCSEYSAPCALDAAPTGDPACANGIANSSGTVCCPPSCGACGVSGCASLPGGENNCCGSKIEQNNLSCLDHAAPCVLEDARGSFTHPGVFNSQAELARIRARKNVQPIKDAYEQELLEVRAACGPCFNPNGLPNFDMPKLASRDYPYQALATVTVGNGTDPNDTSKQRWRDDARAAYANALKWVVSGDSRNAQRSMAIMNAWATTLKSVVSPGGADEGQVALDCAWVTPIFAATAEILRYFDNAGNPSGWSNADFAATQRLLIYLADKAKQSSYQETNQGASAILAQLAAAVVTDDRTRYREGVQAWKALQPRSFFNSNGANTDLMNRDCGHAQYQLIATAQAAEIDYQQGGNLYDLLVGTEAKPRLLQAHELFSFMLQGNSIGTVLYEGAQRTPHSCGVGEGFRGYEMALNHYTKRRTFSITNQETLGGTKNLSDYVLSARPDGSGTFFVGWTTLTHGDIGP
jgi:hypothetical protein